MNATLQARLTTLDAALASLTSSIHALTPSVATAQEVLAADTALTGAIAELTTHQRNHAQLQRLQATAGALEGQLRTALTDLAALRADLAASARAARRPPPSSYRPVDVLELLAAAQNAARFNAPDGFVAPRQAQAHAAAAAAAAASEGADPGTADHKKEDEGYVNGALPPSAPLSATSHGPRSAAAPPDSAHPTTTTAAAGAVRAAANPALASLSSDPALAAWLDPLTQLPFTPWPSTEMIARSGLARSQGWTGGIDVEGELAAAAAADAAASSNAPGAGQDAGQEEEGGAANAADPDEEERRRDEARRRAAAAHARDQEEKPKVFMGMELGDDDDD